MLKRMKRTALTAGLLILAAAAAARAAVPAVLQQVPEDAAVVVVVNNLKSLSTKVSNAATRMNVPVPADLLGEMTQRIHLQQGLDQNGSMAFIVDIPKAKEGEEDAVSGKPFVMLVPTTDAKVMLEPFKPTEPEKGISEVTIPEADEAGFVAKVDKYVAFAQDKAVLERFLARKGTLDKKLTPDLTKAFEANDVVVYANVPQFADRAVKQVDSFKQGLGAIMLMGAGEQAATVEQVMDLYIAGIKRFLSDSEVALLTVRLNDTGATLGLAGHFKPASELGKLVAAEKPLKSINLEGLPAGKLLAAGKFTMEGPMVRDTLAKITKSMPTTAQTDEEKAAFKKNLDLQADLMGLMKSGTFALYEPADTHKGWVNAVMVSEVTDPAKFQQLMAQTLKDQAAMRFSAPKGVKIETDVQENAKTVAGVNFTRITLKYSLAPETPDEPRPPEAEMTVNVLKSIYGPEGLTEYVGVMGTEVLVVAGNEKLLEPAVTAFKANDAALGKTPEIAGLAKSIVSNPSAVLYLPVTRWIELAQREIRSHAKPDAKAPDGGVALGGAAAPIVMSCGASGSNALVELHVPMSTMISIANTIKDAESGMSSPEDTAPMEVPVPLDQK